MNLGAAAIVQGESGPIARRREAGYTMTRAIAVLAGSAPLAAMGHFVAAFWRELTRDAVRPYRPEQHYMRGPGPAWRAKHGLPPR